MYLCKRRLARFHIPLPNFLHQNFLMETTLLHTVIMPEQDLSLPPSLFFFSHVKLDEASRRSLFARRVPENALTRVCIRIVYQTVTHTFVHVDYVIKLNNTRPTLHIGGDARAGYLDERGEFLAMGFLQLLFPDPRRD